MKRVGALLRQALLHPHAAWNGAREFRSSMTLHYDDREVAESYDAGRELAHLVTRRRYEP